MTLEESKISLKTNGYCDFNLKDFSEEYYSLFERIKYKKENTEYLEYFTTIRFDYHNEKIDSHINGRQKFNTFEETNIKKEEILKQYEYEYLAQCWLISDTQPANFISHRFNKTFYDILEYFYGENENHVTMGVQWTCYSEKCFLKDHNDGQGDEYQNTCAILIYLNDEWEEEWGGNLILRKTKWSSDNGIVAYKVIPKFGKVAIIDLKTFDTSHAVEDIIGDHNRCALIAFATSKTKREKPLV